jgi:hypothetical protein
MKNVIVVLHDTEVLTYVDQPSSSAGVGGKFLFKYR